MQTRLGKVENTNTNQVYFDKIIYRVSVYVLENTSDDDLLQNLIRLKLKMMARYGNSLLISHLTLGIFFFGYLTLPFRREKRKQKKNLFQMLQKK